MQNISGGGMEDIVPGISTSPGVVYTVVTKNLTSTSPPLTSTEKHLDKCDMIDYSYDIPTSIICALCFLFGILYTFFGYRLFKATMFLTGFIFGSVLVYVICLEAKALTIIAGAGISLGAGLLCGLLTMLVQYVGLFLTGFNLGAAIATIILVALEQFLHIETKWIPLGILVGIGIVFALVTLKFQKAGTIFGTSIFGGILMIACIDYFIEKFLILHYILERYKAETSTQVCWYSWIIVGTWPFCFLVGTIAQWKITGKGFSHKQVLHNRRRTPDADPKPTRPKEKTKENTHQSRYRHLYQTRRFNGDVISKNYIQTLQDKLLPSSSRDMTPVPTEAPESTNTTLTQLPEV